jgi:two-component system sensor histidine kinase RegB
VRITATWTPQAVRISIADDGPGFSPEVIDQLGEPYVTTRRAARFVPSERGNFEHGGLGLGIFIAKTLLERSGARLRLSNRKGPETGALVTLDWARSHFDAPAVRALAKSAAEPQESLIGGT